MSSSILTKNNDKFFIEGVDVKSIIKKFPTPSYVYSKQKIIDMFKIFFLSELRYSFRNPMVYLFFLIVFLLVFFANVSDNVSIGGSIGNVYRNAPNVITTFSIIMTLFGLLFAAAFFNNSALRDHKNNFQEIIFSKPIDKFGYFMGKFSASLLLSTIPLTGVFFAVIIGSKIAPLMGWIEPERYGPLYFQTFVSG